MQLKLRHKYFVPSFSSKHFLTSFEYLVLVSEKTVPVSGLN